MGEYTPGPWEWSWQDEKYAEALIAKDGTAVLYPDQDSGIGIIVVWIDANASLIKAAPDLLAACEELYRIVLNGMTEDYDEMCAALGRTRAAIAKAKGE